MSAPAQSRGKEPSTGIFVLLIILTILISPVGIISGIVYLVKGARTAGLVLLILGLVLFIGGFAYLHH